MEVSLLNKSFDKIFWINSKKRLDRAGNMNRRFKENNIQAERFNAILGGQIDHRKLQFGKPVKSLDNGEIGCFLSHTTIYKTIKENGWKQTLILEDDAQFKDGWLQKFQAGIKALPSDWDLLYLGQWNYDNDINGGNAKGGKTFALKQQISNEIWKADRCWLTHAYAVNIKCIDYLIENTNVLYSSLDNVLADIQKNLNVYAFSPSLITQDGTKSDLRLNIF